MESNMHLRPHFKTHQSVEVGNWMKEEGIDRCTVSSVSMAKYFVQGGWKDITIAFPVNPREWSTIEELAKQAIVNITVTSPHVVPFLLEHPPAAPMGVYIKIDVGTQRTGFRSTEEAQIEHVLESLKNHAQYTFRGFLCHAGHSYACRSIPEVQEIHEQTVALLVSLRHRFAQYAPFDLSIGDTPTASVATGWEEIDELRAGNFVFYDVMQWQIGAAALEDIAVCLACPVVAKHPDRKTIILYGGGVHLAKDRLIWNDKTIYGFPVMIDEKSLIWSLPDAESYVKGISQEHGVVQASAELFDQIAVGDLLGVLPVHSCMTADLMKGYLTTNSQELNMMQIPQ